ncbi:MAG: hypothetical protein ACFFD1_14500 [Candidatus Thorarchaeota archaeon]
MNYNKESIQQLLSRNPDNVELLIEYVHLLRLEGNEKEAKHYLALAAQKDPNNALVNMQMGLFLFDVNKKDAYKYFLQAKEHLDSTNTNAIFFFIDILWGSAFYELCEEVVNILLKNTHSKDEQSRIEALYDSLVIETEIDYIEDRHQLSILTILAKYLKKTKEQTFYSKLFEKNFSK